jgi:putative GTP pyrophosphokinase
VEPDHFGYFALNLVCSYNSARLSHSEYKPYAGHRFEVQVTSILRHAWSEMEHDWYDLKDRFPPTVKRKFYRLAALLEIAEQEFVDIRKSKKQHQNAAMAMVEAEVPNVAISPASLRAFIEQERLVEQLDIKIVSLLERELSGQIFDGSLNVRTRLLAVVGVKTIEDLRAGLKKYGNATIEYVAACAPLWLNSGRSGAHYEKGICLFHYSMMLLAERGDEALRKLMDELEFNLFGGLDLAEQVARARRILAKAEL